MNSLEIKENKCLLTSYDHLNDHIEKFIKKFEVHPSILAIMENISVLDNFEFAKITSHDILSEISNIDTKKLFKHSL